jgi:NADPH:quinone reductase-like Zn-dependent oxidoreductase
VTAVHPGDAVVINPGLSCGSCAYCQSGDPPLCLQFRILGEHIPGTFTELLTVPQANVRPIPRDVRMDVAAAFPLATLTAWRMLVSRARVQREERVLIWGIGGGVALAAMQIARSQGAEVWVTSSSDAKLDRARSLGADVTLNYRTADVAREVRARTGKRGVDVVVDNVGQATWKQSLGALAKRGRLVTCGATSGPFVETDVRRLFWNQWTIMGSTMGSQSEFDAIVDELRVGNLVPVIDSVFPFSEEGGRKAYERLASGERFGKVVVSLE